MKVVILAGGLGSRLSEETTIKPKPMVEIGGKPILWHIMKLFETYGHNDFIICLGYKGYLIKEYFINYFLYNSDLTIELQNNNMEVHYTSTESFRVTLVDTGADTNTAGRIKKIKKYLNNETFMLTYGDGVTDANINDLVKFHQHHGKQVTLTSVQMPGRFGTLQTDANGLVTDFKEKYEGHEVWINGGFFVLEPGVFQYLEGDMEHVQWEKQPLTEIARNGQLMAYRYNGFWKCMDAMRDKIELEELWQSGKAPWKTW